MLFLAYFLDGFVQPHGFQQIFRRCILICFGAIGENRCFYTYFIICDMLVMIVNIVQRNVQISDSPSFAGQQVIDVTGYQPERRSTDAADTFSFQGPSGCKGLMVQQHLLDHFRNRPVNNPYFHVFGLYPGCYLKGCGE